MHSLLLVVRIKKSTFYSLVFVQDDFEKKMFDIVIMVVNTFVWPHSANEYDDGGNGNKTVFYRLT